MSVIGSWSLYDQVIQSFVFCLFCIFFVYFGFLVSNLFKILNSWVSHTQGGFVRQELFYLLKDEKDVHFAFGSVQKDGIKKATQGMHSSKFCLNIAGDTPSSNRLFDAIASHCVPVIISDDIELPYEDVVDYSQFCIFVRSRDALKEKFLLNLIRGIRKDEWTRMWQKLKEVENLYEFQYPSKEGDAVQMIWQAVARKVPAIRMKLHKSRRFSRSLARSDRGLRLIPSPSNFWWERKLTFFGAVAFLEFWILQSIG